MSIKRAISDCLKLLFLCKNVENSPVSHCPFYGRTEHGYEIVAPFEFGVNLPSAIFYLITQRDETIVIAINMIRIMRIITPIIITTTN